MMRVRSLLGIGIIRLMALSILWACSLLILAALTPSFPAQAAQDPAQVVLFGETEQILENVPGVEAPDLPPTWDIRLGVLAGFVPDYEGSEDYGFSLAPYIRVSWKDRIIWQGRSLSANVIRSKNWRVGPVLKLRAGRNEDDNPALKGLGDVGTSVEIGAQVDYRNGPFRARASIVQDVAAGHDGALAEFGAGIQFPIDRIRILTIVTTSIASNAYLDSNFGVSASQSVASGLRRFDADAGFKDVGITISTVFTIYKGLSAAMSARYWRLIGDAADSPIVQGKGDENQFLGGIGLIYRF